MKNLVSLPDYDLVVENDSLREARERKYSPKKAISASHENSGKNSRAYRKARWDKGAKL